MSDPTKEKGRSFHTATLENKQLYFNKYSQKAQLNVEELRLIPVLVALLQAAAI